MPLVWRGFIGVLEITLNLVPHGIREAERNIGKITIINTGEGTTEFGNYDYKIEIPSRSVEIEGHCEGFDRSRGAMNLLKAILNMHNFMG